jgi:N-acetylglucosamine malate deacetylase 1
MKTLVIAPHPDDELLGCGGTLLRSRSMDTTLGWLIMTKISQKYGWGPERISERESEIQQIRLGLGIQPENLFQLGFPTTRLDTIPMGDLIAKISNVFKKFQPEEVFVPHQGDVHSDHRITFDAISSCTKWFRNPSLKRILAYETLSETEFGLDSNHEFKPNVFVDISEYMEQKIELLSIYASELREFPFPRSKSAIKALAQLRGSNSGFEYAEGFRLLLERID